MIRRFLLNLVEVILRVRVDEKESCMARSLSDIADDIERISHSVGNEAREYLDDAVETLREKSSQEDDEE